MVVIGTAHDWKKIFWLESFCFGVHEEMTRHNGKHVHSTDKGSREDETLGRLREARVGDKVFLKLGKDQFNPTACSDL